MNFSEINLGTTKIGKLNPTFIIAEIGINHQGNLEIAKNLIAKAAECGANAVKFQKRSLTKILTAEGLSKPYNNLNSFGETYGDHKKALELSKEEYYVLYSYANHLNIEFFASGWDEDSIDFLDILGVKFFKISSADLTNFPLLIHTAKKYKPIILSTGMSDIKIVKKAVDLLNRFKIPIVLLQCTSSYPSEFNELNLNVINTYKKEFPNTIVGYSGHELGIAISTAAVALGAKVIERHFTLDRTMKGSDHAASLEPQGFAKMVRDIRNVEKAMGSFDKKLQDSEKEIYNKLKKSIVAKVDISFGSIIKEDMILIKGPGYGISPMRLDEVLGKTAKVFISQDSVITDKDIEWSNDVRY